MTRALSTSATLDLVERLRQILRTFSTSEKTLRDGQQQQLAAETRRAQAAAQQRALRLTEAIAQVEADLKTREQAAETLWNSRRERIDQAHRHCHKRAMEVIQEQEGRHRYTLQKRTLDAERRRESESALAAAQLQQFRERLTDSQDALATLDVHAKRAFSGMAEFGRLLAAPNEGTPLDSMLDENQLLDRATELYEQTTADLARFKKNPLLALFRVLPLWLLVAVAVLGYGVALLVLPYYGMARIPERQATGWLAGSIVLLVLAYVTAKRFGRPAAARISENLATARHLHASAWAKAETRERLRQAEIQHTWEETARQLNQHWETAQESAEQQRAVDPLSIDERRERLFQTNTQRYQHKLELLKTERESRIGTLQAEAAREEERTAAVLASKRQALENQFAATKKQLQEEWFREVQPIWQALDDARQSAEQLFLPWSDPAWKQWQPPAQFTGFARFGHLEVDVSALAGLDWTQTGLEFPGPLRFSVPLQLVFPEEGSLLFETKEAGGESAIASMNALLFRLLSLAPPGRVNFTIFDPAGLGQSFAGLMHLADYEESQVNSRIWTQTSQMEEKLAELAEHMEKVIQMYLRNEYATIAEYNAQAGSMAEKYHFLVVAGFPAGFSETAGRRLLNIAASGARCGVFTLIQWDQRRELPHDFVPDELRKHSVRIRAEQNRLVLADRMPPGTRLLLETPPPPEFAVEFLQRVGQGSKNANRVELPFAEIAPKEDALWSDNSGDEFRIAIGRSGASKAQEVALGKGTRQHGLVAGKTGSGKSTLFHVLITNTALHYSPEQVELYLVDFKKGVEFKCYADQRLPHARVVAIESDREFGLSVLHRIDEELRVRGELFRKAGVQDLPGFRRAEPTRPLPRVLLIIDEFQELFTEEDRVSQTAAMLLDRIVRQGRAFGIHALLGSQTLGGAYTLARATVGQMVIRIALQCNEADAYLIMDESNSAARLLSRPGEGIYNDMAGALEGNSPFQTAWLDDTDRDHYLQAVRHRADQQPDRYPGPVIFEGNAPADLRENQPLRQARLKRPTTGPLLPRIWLGAPNAIKGPTEAVLPRQSGANLLIVGQSEDALLGMPGLALISLAAQFPVGGARLILIESTAPGSPDREFLDRVVTAVACPVLRPKRAELGALLNQLVSEESSEAGSDGSEARLPTFLIVVDLQEHKLLRQEDEFSYQESGESPAAQFLKLITEGPSRGIHVVASVDTYSNVTRCLGRKALGEFQARVLFQMSANDSASLMDSPEASKLGLHRALFYNDREGYIEKFRPYALHGSNVLEHLPVE